MGVIINSDQQKGIKTFEHAVNRCMKIIGDGNWKTPIGFHHHDEKGRAVKAEVEQRELSWIQSKQQEISGETKTSIEFEIENRKKRSEKESLTGKALSIAESLKRLVGRGNQQSDKDLVTRYFGELKTLFEEGADRKIIESFLKGEGG